MVGVEGFIAGLRALGYEPDHRGSGLVVFDYEVEVGPAVGLTVQLALRVPPDWPVSPPGGPLVSPRLLAINPDGSRSHPYGGIHEAPDLGPTWEYWSRPFASSWPSTDRSVVAYFGHLRRLFDTLPDEVRSLRDAA